MKNIEYYYAVDLSVSSMRTLSKKDNGTFLYPYKDVKIDIHEVHRCPFCGKIVREFKCDCKAFSKAFAKLQDSCGDKDHESRLHRSGFDFDVSISRSISEFKVKTLKKKEILALDPNTWDYANRCVDQLTDKSYMVTPAVLAGENLFMLCKDLVSKVVYRFETSKVEYTNKPVSIGIYSRKTVPGLNPKKIGGYSFENYWNDFRKFEDWNEVCEELKKIGKFTSDKDFFVASFFIFSIEISKSLCMMKMPNHYTNEN